MDKKQQKGAIYLIPTIIAPGTIDQVMTPSVRTKCQEINYYLVENLRTARRYLSELGIKQPIDSLRFEVIRKDTNDREFDQWMDPILGGTDCGVLSEAGCPAIADPGAILVNKAHQKGVRRR